MGSLGTILRREREARGISLEEISEKTKIGIRLLRAIENEQFDKLPGGLFNKSFVRQYARVLGVDEEIAVREYLEASGARRETPAAQRSRPPEPSFSAAPDSSRLIPAILAIVILIAGIAYGGYRLYGYLTAPPAAAQPRTVAPAALPGGATTTTAAVEPAEDYEAPAAVAESEAPQSEGLTPTRPSTPEPLPEAASGADSEQPEELALRIDSHGPVWLSITADGVRQWQGIMRANQTREVQAAESVRLTVGDAAAVSLTLNGKSLPGLGRPGEVKNLTITAKDAAEIRP